MTCQVARSYQHFVQMEPVPCSECGSTYMDVRVASGTLRPHLCPICAQSLSPARRIFRPRAVRADETSEGCLNRSRREPGITSGAGATTLLEGSQQSRL